MLADVLEGMRGRVVDELARRAAVAGGPPPPGLDERARLDALVRQVIEALRSGTPGDGSAPLFDGDPERALAEHELVARYLAEQIEHGRFAGESSDTVVVDRWRCQADRSCLREQSRRLAALLDGVYESAAMLAPDGRILYCNRRAAQALREKAGVPRSQIIGRTPEALGVPIDLFVGHPVGDLVGLARAHQSFETNAWGRTAETQFDAIYEPDGSVGAVSLLIHDVTNRKQAQMRLDLLSKLGALVGVLDFDEVAEGLARVPLPELADWCTFSLVEGRRIRRTFVATAAPEETPLREAVSRALNTADRHPLWQEMLTGGFQLLSEVSDDLLRRLTFTDEQYQVLHQIGIRSVMTVPLVSRGQLKGVISLVYTKESGRRYGGDDPALAQELALHAARALENARLMKELKASEARFRVALAGARTVVFEQDAALRYTWYYNPLAPSGKPPEESLPSEEAAALTRTKRRVLERGEGVRDEIDLTLGSDERRHYREAIEPMRDHTGKVVGIIGAATDITEQQRMQQQLAADVCYRERMMGILSHDLRNPLNAISLSDDFLLQRADLDEKQREQLQRIRRSTERMKEMIETLLDFTRLRFLGAFPISPAPTELGDVARGVLDEMRAARPGRSIELRVSGSLDGEWDPARMSQAISNLVGNAIAYGEAESPVRVELRGDGGDVVVTVNNRGAPVPPETLAVIFEPFRRGVPEDRSPHGLGLGLYVVRQIVLAHDGRIDVESNATDGTTFTMRLPRHSQAVQRPDTQSESGPQPRSHGCPSAMGGRQLPLELPLSRSSGQQ
jgi:signal transduction histidine kinase